MIAARDKGSGRVEYSGNKPAALLYAFSFVCNTTGTGMIATRDKGSGRVEYSGNKPVTLLYAFSSHTRFCQKSCTKHRSF